MSGLIDTPEGFAWLGDRATLATLPAERQQWWRDFHDEVWEAVICDPAVHEGCAPADELHATQRELREAHIAELTARTKGYKEACADVLKRIEEMGPGDGPGPVYTLGFNECRARMAKGIERLRERGPATEEAA